MNRSITQIAGLMMCFMLAGGLSGTYAQGPGIDWETTIGGDDLNQALGMKSVSGGGMVLTGRTDGMISGYWAVTIDASGTINDQTTLEMGHALLRTVIPTNDGGYIGAGQIGGNNNDWDVRVAKVDNMGASEWTVSLAGSRDEGINDIQQTSDGGYILAGYTASRDGNISAPASIKGRRIWVVKLSSAGALQWQKIYGATIEIDLVADWANAIQETNDGGYILAGHISSRNIQDLDVDGENGQDGAIIMKLSASGSMEWENYFPYRAHATTTINTAFYTATSVRQCADGSYVFAGKSLPDVTDIDKGDFGIGKLSSSGTTEWVRHYGGSEEDMASDIELAADGGYIVAGQTKSDDGDVSGYHPSPYPDYWLIKLNDSGLMEWQRALGGSGSEGLTPSSMVPEPTRWERCFIAASENGVYNFVGTTSSTNGDIADNGGNFDAWAVQLGAATTIPGVDYRETLVRVFPNPSAGLLYVACKERISLHMVVYDLRGRVMLQEQLDAHPAVIDLGDLPDGTYFYHLSNEHSRVASGKILLHKN